jgi:hypothetical protein
MASGYMPYGFKNYANVCYGTHNRLRNFSLFFWIIILLQLQLKGADLCFFADVLLGIPFPFFQIGMLLHLKKT